MMSPTAAATPLLDLLRSRGVFARSPFTLVDAGCRGGIGSMWRRFAPHLVAHGFDPLVDECERLSQAEPLETVHYHARYVGLPADDPFILRRQQDTATHPNRNPWSRLSAARAAEILRARGPGDAPSVRLADPAARVGIAEFAGEQNVAAIDFLKIDVDGDDYAVLRSADGVLDHVLGVRIEVNYFGSDSDTDNTFHNVDRYMRARGFDLFALNSRLYSHAALPAPFAGRGPGQTTSGPPLQGHALYLRDCAAPYAREAAMAREATAFAKLAALFELFRLPDCAAELISTFRDRFSQLAPPDLLLDAVASGVGPLAYHDYLNRFEADPIGDTAVVTTPVPPVKPDRTLAELRARHAAVQERLRSCRKQYATLRQQHAGLRTRVRAMESSLVWRISAPWRRFRRRRAR